MSSVNALKSNVGGKLISVDDLKQQSQGISTNTLAIWAFLLYLIIGLSFYCFHESMSALNCIYFSIITFTSVGYGNTY
jgi:hypothetical protein